jgi:glycine/D-amino acid oxidase-like deaminating enzyme
MEVDYLIIGQGIAGSMLGHFLMHKNKSVLFVDNDLPTSSSRVAAGLFNPITGRRIVKTWKADVLLPFAEKTYKKLEAELEASFYFKKNIVKVFTSIKEQNDWLSKSSQPEFEPYVCQSKSDIKNDCLQLPFGFFEISKAGYVDLPLLLATFKNYLMKHKALLIESFNFEDLKLLDTGVAWKQVYAKKIIFCEGHMAVHNTFFRHLPFVLTKGELLTIHSENLNLEKIISRGIFILPLGADRYKIGSTYSWNDLSDETTENARIQLLEKLSPVINCPFTVINQQAGIRPTVKDRRPLIGLHPHHPNIGIFNGMGTKGASLAPYFANHFANVLEGQEGLDKEVDINRFSSETIQ